METKNQIVTREILIEKGFKSTPNSKDLTYELNTHFEIDCVVMGNVFKGVVGSKGYSEIKGNDKQGICIYFENYTVEMLDALIFGLTTKHIST
jgi:hypothetical protein